MPWPSEPGDDLPRSTLTCCSTAFARSFTEVFGCDSATPCWNPTQVWATVRDSATRRSNGSSSVRRRSRRSDPRAGKNRTRGVVDLPHMPNNEEAGSGVGNMEPPRASHGFAAGAESWSNSNGSWRTRSPTFRRSSSGARASAQVAWVPSEHPPGRALARCKPAQICFSRHDVARDAHAAKRHHRYNDLLLDGASEVGSGAEGFLRRIERARGTARSGNATLDVAASKWDSCPWSCTKVPHSGSRRRHHATARCSEARLELCGRCRRICPPSNRSGKAQADHEASHLNAIKFTDEGPYASGEVV